MKIRIILFLMISAIVIMPFCFTADGDDVEYMTEPCLVPTKDNRFRLCDNMIVHIDDKYHVVPRGFKTDLASIPRIIWPVFSPGDYDSIAPAVLHDWHYCCTKDIDRLKADDVYYYGLISLGMNPVKAWIYYIGVRMGGAKSFMHGGAMQKHFGEFDEAELQGAYEDANTELG